MLKQVTIIACVALLLTGCLANRPQQQNGAMTSRAVGHKTGSPLLGAGISGALGKLVDKEMDKTDRQQLINVYEYTPDHTVTAWRNPDTGNQFKVTPERTYVDLTTHRDCRQVEILSTIDGKEGKTEATACRENGRWVIH